MKNFILIFLISFITGSCKKEQAGSFKTEEKSIEFVVKKFPMISKNLKQVRKVNLDSFTITLFRDVDKDDYDEIIVFEKNQKFYSIPLFSNMYFDYWGFQNEKQLQLYKRANTTFEQQLKDVIRELKLSPDEFRLMFDELMLSVLHTETELHLKPKIFQNYIYLTERVDKYKIEEHDSCIERTNRIFEKIQNDSKETIWYFKYYLDAENGRVYELRDTSHLTKGFSFQIKTYRIDCFSYPLNI